MFCLICMDRPGSQDLRLANRPDHLAYVQENPGVVVAGPFLSEGRRNHDRLDDCAGC